MGEDGNIVIPPKQMDRILNFDESCLSLNGSESRGGRPSAAIFYPNLPCPGAITSKSGYSLTFIGGSTASGQALPPHLQFPTSAKIEEREKMRMDIGNHLKFTNGTWGLGKLTSMPVTLGVNEKGGMDEEEFEKFLRNSFAI
ncbi:unnamed protein product [Cylindrotheca closterium]|uniref:Uncharacterized protein n=1 Tax=Cylindrotheca closterium TaxID=2856 RepID=A0AAD2CM96_9STRA|nr:unnamed protein product [Cylindrotheca closterium]